jgi:hypothetical protein
MIALLDTSEDLKVCEAEIGVRVEQLLTPLTRFKVQYPRKKRAIENGGFVEFREKAYLALLEREAAQMDKVYWTTVPDVPGSARRTLECFEFWYPRLCEWPLAFVCQDGQEDLPIPWEHIAAVFIGGSTSWKLSHHAAAIVKAAKIMGKLVHAGRVNTPGRFEYFEKLGADSIDGTGLSRYSHMREEIWKRNNMPNLFTEIANESNS